MFNVRYPIRYAGEADWKAITELDGASFGFDYDDEARADARFELDVTRCLVANDAARIVGLSADLPFRMTLPGGEVGAAGITWVSVELTHRRRGILRSLVERQLRDRAADGMAAAILTAAEGGIYGRFGFGIAERKRRTIVERRQATLLRRVGDVSVARLSTDQARGMLPAIYDRWRRGVPGGLNRPAGLWQLHLLDRASQRHGYSGLFHLVHPDGYVSYRVKEDWNDGLPRHTCSIVDYVVVTTEAHAALWQVLLGMDLVGSFETTSMPVDDPLPQLLADARAVRTTADVDGMWVRPLDVAALLSARTYAVDVDVVLAVCDPIFGDARYRLHGGPHAAICTQVDDAADVWLGVGELGAVSLGGTRLAALARAGRVRGDPALLSRLDRALLADRAPQAGTNF